jgi:hypothetical protein
MDHVVLQRDWDCRHHRLIRSALNINKHQF